MPARLKLQLILTLAGFLSHIGCALAQREKPLVYLKHMELSFRYPALARQARLQGTVTVKLTIAADGTVLTADSSSDDLLLTKYPLLQAQTAELVKKWTFGCFDCPAGNNFEHVIRVIYKLGGDPKSYDDTRIVLDLPNEVLITANPPECDHCPRQTKPKTLR